MAKSRASRQRRRLSDTAVLASMPPSRAARDESASVSVNIRRIDNGYVIRETRCGSGMAYEERERYSREKPPLPRLDI